jgi:riboflavin kinase/FMN adenylyltransferase
MNIIYDLDKIEGLLKNPVLTIGNFDGVHRGHLRLFNKVKERATAIQGQSAVMTFEPHPLKVVGSGNGPPLITTTEEKLQLIRNAGIDFILCIPFTSSFAAISAEDFVEKILVEKIGIREIVVGYDYTFGHKRMGNISFLQEMGGRLRFRVHVLEPVYIGSALVSSTFIRQLIREGDLPQARKFLGRSYKISGMVVSGRNRGGRLLGFPTANLKPSEELIPKEGVYAVSVEVEGTVHYGVTNIGTNPTFRDEALSIETHILDFSGDLLGKTIRVNFIQRLRDEKRFSGVRELSDQIDRDIQEARRIFHTSAE